MNENGLVTENDLLAVNNLPLQESDFIEWMDEVIKARTKVPFVVISVSILFYGFVLVCAFLDMKAVSSIYIVLVTACLLIALLLRYTVSRPLGRLRYNQYSLSRSECHRTIVFYKDHLELRAGNETITRLAYSNIKKIALTKNLLIISFPHLTNCVARRDGFAEKDFNIIMEHIKSGMKNGDM